MSNNCAGGYSDPSSPLFDPTCFGTQAVPDVSLGSFDLSGLGDLFGGISKAIALDYRAITQAPPANIQALPGGGYVVNGQVVQGQAPLGGIFGNAQSSPLIIIALVIGAVLLLRKS